MSKIATDLEQSKKLAEILPILTADMTWGQVSKSLSKSFEWKLSVGLDEAIKLNLFSYRNGYVVPAWSLSALLELMPSEVGDNHYLTLDKKHYEKGDEYCCCYEDCNGNSSLHVFANDSIDACVEMILKLKEKGE